MRSGKGGEKLYLYIIVSLMIHLIIFYFFPLGNINDTASGQGKGEKDFGFVQYVELKKPPEKSETTNKNKETNIRKKEEKKKEEKEEKKQKVSDFSDLFENKNLTHKK